MISRNSINGAFPIRRLGEVVEFLDSKRRPVTESDRRAGPYPYYGANGLQDTIDDFIFDEPLVLLAEDGGHFGEPGRSIAYRISGKTWVNKHAHVLRPTSDIDLAYVCRVLENYDVTPLVTGTTRGKLTKAGATQIVIPLPPLAEQRRIAEVLDRAEALRGKRRATLAQLDSLTQSLFLDLFGDPNTPARRIGDLLESGVLLLHKDGNHGSLYPRADDFGGEGIPYLSAKAVSDDGLIDNALVENLREDKAEKLRIGWISKGDVLLAHNASVGKVALYDGRFERALIGTSLTAFRPNLEALDSQYLAAALRSAKFQRQLEKNMGQTTRNQVPITAQRELRIGLPPIELQREFARRVRAVEKLKAAQRASLAELDTLFATLQHRAFQGEL